MFQVDGYEFTRRVLIILRKIDAMIRRLFFRFCIASLRLLRDFRSTFLSKDDFSNLLFLYGAFEALATRQYIQGESFKYLGMKGQMIRTYFSFI